MVEETVSETGDLHSELKIKVEDIFLYNFLLLVLLQYTFCGIAVVLEAKLLY